MIVHVIDLGDWAVPGEPHNLVARRLARRRRAFQAASERAGFGRVMWACATCGGLGHGQPTVAGASVSTSSHGDWAVIAFGSIGERLGIDVTTRAAPREADAIALRHFTLDEREQCPPGGWREGSGFALLWSAKEALGKAHGVGIAVEQPEALGGPLDSIAHAASIHRLRADPSLPAHLIGRAAILVERPGTGCCSSIG